jgi:voltage-gated potassium channel
MNPKFFDLLFSIVIRLHWRYIAYGILFGFIGSWELSAYYDPTSSIIQPREYWWYFINSVLRGGYSGYTPDNTGARLVALITSIFVSIFVLAMLTKIVAATYEHTQRRKKGVAMLKLTDHIVFLGYRPGETEAIIAQILADYQATRPNAIVLCTKKLSESPYPGDATVFFVQGDTASDEVLERACVKDARKIVVSGHEDARTMAVCLAVNDVLVKAKRTDAHITAHIEDRKNERFLYKINPDIECVMSLRPMLIAQAVVNSGISALIRELVDLNSEPSLYRINIPDEVPELPFLIVSNILLSLYKAIPIAVGSNHSPHPKVEHLPNETTTVRGGMCLFYKSRFRIDGVIDWNAFEKATFNPEDPMFVTLKTAEVRESLLLAQTVTS